MKKYILTIGLNDKDTKQPKYDIITAYKMIESACKQYTEGYSLYQTKGGYKHDDGTFVQEDSIRAEFLYTTEVQVRCIANAIKAPTCLNQESIMFEVVETEIAFI